MGLVPDYFPMRRCGVWMHQPGALNKTPATSAAVGQPRSHAGRMDYYPNQD